MKKAEVVFFPFPTASHLVPTLEFAKLLISRNSSLRITVLLMKFPHMTETDVYTKSLPISDSLNFINLPECSLPPNTDPRSTIPALIEAHKPNVKQVVSDLTTGEGQHGHLAAFVVDMFCTSMIDIAKEFSVPALVFFTCGVASLGANLHFHTLRDSVDLNQLLQATEFTIPTFANLVPSHSLPGSVLSKEWGSFFMNFAKGVKNSDGIIVNSFEELESYAVHSFFSHHDLAGLPVIYPVGPILNPELKTKDTSDSDDIIKWLDDQPPSSVVFLCFGGMGTFDEDQVKEIAFAVESSGARFVWSLRKPKPKGIMAPPTDYPFSELVSVLPEGFLDRTTDIGKVIGWAPQTQILAHPATGGFVSHCGWNSTLESIHYGVPIATWPIFAEQQTNAFQLVSELKMGVEIALDYRVEIGRDEPNYLVTADKIERGIRNVLDNDGDVRKNVKEMSEKSKKTFLEGGSSYAYLGRLIDYIMNQM